MTNHAIVHQEIVRKSHWQLEAVAGIELLDLLLQIS